MTRGSNDRQRGARQLEINLERMKELYWPQLFLGSPLEVYDAAIVEGLAEKYNVEAGKIAQIVLCGEVLPAGFPACIEAQVFPLGAARVVQVYSPIVEFLERLGQLEELDPLGHLRITTPEERRVLAELAERGRSLRALVEKAEEALRERGMRFDDSGRLVLEKRNNRSPDYVRKVVVELYRYLSTTGGVHGNLRSLQEDIQKLLHPVVRIPLKIIRSAIDNHLHSPKPRRSQE